MDGAGEAAAQTRLWGALPGWKDFVDKAELEGRTKDFALRVIRFVAQLPKTRVTEVLGYQLLKAGTSVGANYRLTLRQKEIMLEKRLVKTQRKQMPTALKMTAEEMAMYRATTRRRWQQEQQELAQRQERAWEVARHATTLLKEQFGATRVVVFGSLVHAGCFTRWSDVDIAAWGIPPQETFQAIGAVEDIDTEIEVNLVDVGACRPSLRATIEREGVEL